MYVSDPSPAPGPARVHAANGTRCHGSRPRWRRQIGRVAVGILLSQLVAATGCGTLGSRQSAPLPLAHNPAAASLSSTEFSAAAASATQAQPTIHPAQRSAALAQQAVPAAAASVVAASYQGEIMDHSSLACASPAGGPCSCCGTAAVSQDNYRNAQEYIYDGGDLPPTAVVKQDWSTIGINPTDTVIHYETLAGTVCVHPSNRVSIYAPRFGAVRQVSGLQLSTRAVGTERILAPLAVERLEEQNLAGTVMLPVAPHGEEQVGLIDAFQENYVGTPLDQVQPLSRMSAARVPFELVDLRRTGLITRQEVIDVQQLIQNAQTWVIPESLEIEISNQTAVVVKDTQAPEDVVLYETPDKCAMRIFKAASHTIANSGDIVSFAIRFDNAGVKPLGNVVITDSLAPRLNYIEGSQQCSLGVRFSVEPNDVGAMILRWEIEDPIQPSEGGVVTFDCQVR